jgi:ribosome maturation factor RimP
MEAMSFEEIQQRIETIAQRVFESEGMDLVECKVAGHKNDVMIQITADKPSGGINIRECAILNKLLVAAIEQENFLPPEIFSLELSSPGLDRPLVTRRDFMRVCAQELHFWLTEPVGGKKEVQGILAEVGESELTIDVVIKKTKAKLVLPLSSIIKGELVI